MPPGSVLLGPLSFTGDRVDQTRQEAHSRLTGLLTICEYEVGALEALDDGRLALIVERMHAFRLDLVAALEGLDRAE